MTTSKAPRKPTKPQTATLIRIAAGWSGMLVHHHTTRVGVHNLLDLGYITKSSHYADGSGFTTKYALTDTGRAALARAYN